MNLLFDIRKQITSVIAAELAKSGITEEIFLTPPINYDFGDLTLPCYRFSKVMRKAPQAIAAELIPIVKSVGIVSDANAVSGYLNISLNWADLSGKVCNWVATNGAAHGESNMLYNEKHIIEFSSPNTNKPQHLGHCRNNILGAALSSILKNAGANVVSTNLVNDRGIHICKSMIAWQRWGDGITPESSGKKGDHLVGEFYVRFNTELKAEYKARYPSEGPGEEVFFNTESELGSATRAMLLAWEEGDKSVLDLWSMMNSWCKSGFNATYTRMGINFDTIEYESNTYTLGKSLITLGLNQGVFHTTKDGAIAFDLTKVSMEGEKIVLRADGTSIYITQDIGTAITRHQSANPHRMIYVVGNEQDHYFSVLFKILEAIQPELKGKLFHRSYGMVELPDGKMKSREGTVVDADNLMDDLHNAVFSANVDRWSHLSTEEQHRRSEAIAMSGLRYFLLKASPNSTICFDKKTSISIEGDTGPYCQYAYARCIAIINKAGVSFNDVSPNWSSLTDVHSRRLLMSLLSLPDYHCKAITELDPSLVAKGLYELAKAFSSFYASPEGRVIGADTAVGAARLSLVNATKMALESNLTMLGITPLDEM